MGLKPRSIRIRLTLWYVSFLAVLIFGFALAVYLFVQSSLLRQVDQQLERDFTTVIHIVSDEPGELGELAKHGTVGLFGVAEGNKITAATRGWRSAGLDKVMGERRHNQWSWTAPDGQAYRVKTGSVSVRDRIVTIAIAQDELTFHQSMHSLAIILSFGIPCVLALGVIGGYLLAGRVLSPIGSIVSKVREITAERLSERLPVDNPADEFGQLALVFNETFTRLEDSFARLRRFTDDASHELRTPLTAIRSVGEVGLQENISVSACREVIGSMLEETDRLTKLVDSLLTLSRADSGTVVTSHTVTDLTELVAEVTDCLIVLAEEKEQNLTLVRSSPVFAAVDRSILRQAVINLLDNAIKFTPRSGHLGVVVRITENGEAAIEICDDGPGIAPKERALIFDRFYRVDRGRSREIGGTGLGLSIARWAVEINNGRIELESEEGEGSTFRIVLPGVRNI